MSARRSSALSRLVIPPLAELLSEPGDTARLFELAGPLSSWFFSRSSNEATAGSARNAAAMQLERAGRPTDVTTELRELARRRSVGSDVVLSWSPETRRVFVDVEDELEGAVRLLVDGADALDAFNHPYAYLEAA
jgi:hypothetical protein